MTVSLVTRAGSGVGAATAAALSERGDVVIDVDVDGAAARRDGDGGLGDCLSTARVSRIR